MFVNKLKIASMFLLVSYFPAFAGMVDYEIEKVANDIIKSQAIIAANVRNNKFNDIKSLLVQFEKQPEDLGLIAQLRVNADRMTSYAIQRVKYPIKRKELTVLVYALSLTNNKAAINFLVNLSRKYPQDVVLLSQVLSVLTELQRTIESDAYFDYLIATISENDLVKYNVIESAFLAGYTGINRLMTKYRTPSPDNNMQYMGLYLSSLQRSDKKIKQWILQALNNEKAVPIYKQYYLLIALSRQLNDTDFKGVLSRLKMDKRIVDNVLLERQFHLGDANLRENLAPSLALSNHQDQKIKAISFLLRQHGFEKTWSLLNQKQRLTAVRLAGKLEIEILSKQKQRNISEDVAMIDDRVAYLLTGVAIVVLMFVSYLRIRKSSLP